MYIEINLLPQSFRPKKRLIRLDYKSALVLVILIGVVAVGGYYYYLKKELANIESQMTFYRQEETKLRAVLALNNEVKDLRASVEERVAIIKELTGDSDIRLAMLDHINKVLIGDIWLMNISEIESAGKISYNIEGMSYSKDDISAFIAGLEKFDKFSLVSLESINPAPLEIRDAFNYVVNVELKSETPQETETDTRTAARRPAGR